MAKKKNNILKPIDIAFIMDQARQINLKLARFMIEGCTPQEIADTKLLFEGMMAAIISCLDDSNKATLKTKKGRDAVDMILGRIMEGRLKTMSETRQ